MQLLGARFALSALLTLSIVHNSAAIYDHFPAERYATLFEHLSAAELADVRAKVYDQSASKAQILENMKAWAWSSPPLTQASFDLRG